MGETTLTSGRPFGVTAGEILGREPSGGRLAFEEVARQLALEIGAGGIVICTKHRESGKTELGAVWALDGYAQARLERDATDGVLCDVLERHRPVEVDATQVWEFEAWELGFGQGLAIPVADREIQAMVCALYDGEPDVHRAVITAGELEPFLTRLAR
jgi:hypothetical protein